MDDQTGGPPSTPETSSDSDDDRRFEVRYRLAGGPIAWRQGKTEASLRIKDLSSSGASGFIEEPLAIGDMIMIEFDPKHCREAEVRWVRGLSVGLRFNRPLDPRFVRNVQLQMAWAVDDQDEDWL